jgi:DNA polymerase-1
VPTFSPAEIYARWVPNDITSKFDLQRIKEQSGFPKIKKTKRITHIPATAQEVGIWLNKLRGRDKLSVDIESSMATHNLICVGFGLSANEAVVFGVSPYMFDDESKGASASVAAIKELLASPTKKVLQNGNFDITFLKFKGFDVKNFYFDTLYAHHLLQVELPKSLAYLTSVYTDQPYFKDMVSHSKQSGQMEWNVMARYNGLDCMTTYEIGEILEGQVREAGLWDFYQRKYIRMHEPLMEAQLEGVRINVDARAELEEELQKDLDSLDEELLAKLPDDWMPSKDVKQLDAMKIKIHDMMKTGKHRKKDGELTVRYLNLQDKIAGFKRDVNFGSPMQVGDILYGLLKIPKRYKYGKVTTDDTALNKIIRSRTVKEEDRLFCGKLLERRGLSKLINTYLNCPIDDDNRMRCTYNVAGTKTGRLSSQSNIFGTGQNLQNIPKRKGRGGAIRNLFLPDEGDVFVAADYGQAEARVVGYASGERGFIRCFEEDRDLFKYVASKCFNIPEDEVVKAQRNIAKVVVHGGNYGMALGTLAFNLGMTTDDAEPIKLAYDREMYRLQEWRDETRDQIDLTRRLTTPFGRYRIFYDRVKTIVRNKDGSRAINWNNNYLRDAFSYYPQSTVGDLLNEAVLRTWDRVHVEKWKIHRPKFRLQVHDEQIWSVHPDDVEQFKVVLAEAMDIPITINGKTFTIPTDQAVGETWADLD